MRNNVAVKAFFAIVVSFGVLSCNSSKEHNGIYKATGWDVDAEGGFNYNSDFEEQDAGPGLVFVEGGTFTMGRVQDDVMHDWNNTPTQQHVQSFYMDETEVTNLMYLTYLDYLKRVYPPEQEKYRSIYIGALPDTLVWRNRLGYNETMINNYLRHPAYANYPVVGVSWIQAVEFSDWRTDMVNESRLIKKDFVAEEARTNIEPGQTFDTETYLNAPSKVYGGNDEITRGGDDADRFVMDDGSGTGDSTAQEGLYVRRKHGILLPEYRLPTEAEWEYAAKALVGVRSYNIYRGRKKYPWEGQYTTTGDTRNRGDLMANFKQGNGDYGGIAGWSNDGADITAEVKSYPPNDFGLYDMAGNVAEWVADVYRPIIDDEFNDFNYYRGNVYMENAISEDGTVQVLGMDEINFDTLSNGKVIARNLPGEIKTVPYTPEEGVLRTNFNESDNRDFRDGDQQSSRNYNSFAQTDVTIDEPVDATPFIDNNVRVYKGGSWRDRAYWLDPAQRRFFPQDMATDYIGFRNAMSRVGSKALDDKKTATN
ncbi:MAG TPA: gliding motility lipoprotein GldJ [Salinimicrobium sp.]|nr:gliding motility lipoprotein GldJ [Salinimicrobium sp.]